MRRRPTSCSSEMGDEGMMHLNVTMTAAARAEAPSA